MVGQRLPDCTCNRNHLVPLTESIQGVFAVRAATLPLVGEGRPLHDINERFAIDKSVEIVQEVA